jgi:hypothetical protein
MRGISSSVAPSFEGSGVPVFQYRMYRCSATGRSTSDAEYVPYLQWCQDER